MRTAVGTSLVIITATSLLGLAAHLLAGRDIDAGVTATMTRMRRRRRRRRRIAGRIPQRALSHGFAVLVLGVAGYLLVSVAFLGGPPGAA